MHHRHKQSGMSFWGLALSAFLVAFFTLLTLKLVPPYIINAKIRTGLQNTVKQPNAANMTKIEITESLQRRLDVDDVRTINLKNDLTISKSADGRTTELRIAYDVRIPLAYNISALLSFDEKAEAR